MPDPAPDFVRKIVGVPTDVGEVGECAQCGEPFVARRYRQVTCSRRCCNIRAHILAFEKKYPGALAEGQAVWVGEDNRFYWNRKCSECGKDFHAVHKHQVCCSAEKCRASHKCRLSREHYHRRGRKGRGRKVKAPKVTDVTEAIEAIAEYVHESDRERQHVAELVGSRQELFRQLAEGADGMDLMLPGEGGQYRAYRVRLEVEPLDNEKIMEGDLWIRSAAGT